LDEAPWPSTGIAAVPRSARRDRLTFRRPTTAACPQNARPLPGGLLQIRQVGARDASVRSARAQEVRAEDDDGLREIIRSGSGATGDGSAHHIVGDKSATASDSALAGRLARTATAPARARLRGCGAAARRAARRLPA